MLKIENLHARVARSRDPQGPEPRGPDWRGARHHGPERLGQEHARAGARRPRRLRGHGRRRRASTAGICSRWSPRNARARDVFLAFQYPIEIPGVNNAYLLKAALNAQRQARGEPPIDAFEFMKLIKSKMELMQIPKDFSTAASTRASRAARRSATKFCRCCCSSRRLAVLDETDSGLDVDALKIVAAGVNSLRSPDALDAARNSLRAAARAHRAGPRARARRWPHREIRRPRTRARARCARLRLGAGGGGRLVSAAVLRAGARGPVGPLPGPARGRRCARPRSPASRDRAADAAAGGLALHGS